LATAQKAREERIADRRTRDERDIAQDQQREDALQRYFDRLTDLLVAGKLRRVVGDPQPGTDEENSLRVNLALRSRTLTTLRRLDGARKGHLLRFLSELRLIDADKHILYLEGADLRDAQLSHANLHQALLRKADLRAADLSHSSLDEADLGDADLREANVKDVQFWGTRLTSELCTSNVDLSQVRGVLRG
jgi:uncharacterized protein YjbI with pentapeptide repeats